MRDATGNCRGRSLLPVVATRHIELTGADRAAIGQLALALANEYRHLSSLAFFGAGVKTGLGPAPAILIGDKSEIPMLAPTGEDMLEYRIALLAGQDDLVLFAGARNPDFEAYLSGLLGLPGLNILEAPPAGSKPRGPTARRCMEDPKLDARLAEHVCARRGATLLPHISTGSIWALAKHMHERTGEPISVAAPPPNLSNRVNDKLWFADVAIRLLGKGAVPPKLSAFGPAALTGHVRGLARKWEKIVVKVPDSAGSAGNFPIRSATIRDFGARRLRHHLMERLAAAAWPQTFPLLVEVWDCNVLASPSVQIWIPHLQDGDPIIEGVFDQVLSGEEGRFIGAAPTVLEPSWDDRVCRDAMKLALLFQHLGYFGRCSFDTVIAGDSHDDAELHWIECNGRWGGVSLPMTFLNRLFGADALPAYVIVQRPELNLPPLPFHEALRRLDDLLYRPDGPPEGIILVTPDCLVAGAGLHMIAMDETIEKAMRRADQAVERLGMPGAEHA